MRVPNPSPVLDQNCASMGPEIISSTGAGVWRKAPKAFPHSHSVLDKFPSAKLINLPNVFLETITEYSRDCPEINSPGILSDDRLPSFVLIAQRLITTPLVNRRKLISRTPYGGTNFKLAAPLQPLCDTIDIACYHIAMPFCACFSMVEVSHNIHYSSLLSGLRS